MESPAQQAKNLGISRPWVTSELSLTKQGVQKWWGDITKVPRKHIEKMEGWGFRFPGRHYESAEKDTVRPTPEEKIEAQGLVDQVVGELTTPEQRRTYLALVDDVAEVIHRLRAAGRGSEIRLVLEKSLQAAKAIQKGRP